MKKIFPFLLLCLASFFVRGNENPPLELLDVDSTCFVSIGIDSSNTGDVLLVAYPSGNAPFAYLWSTGATTSSIIVTTWGINYCVTVTDADGCTASDCLFNQNTCTTSIVNVPLGYLSSVSTGIPPFTYAWSDGSTTPSIPVNAPGTYCVTVVDAINCSSQACYDYGTLDSCNVYIVQDTSNAGSYFTAIANGTPPFSYTWQPSGNGQSTPLDPAYFGDYCVTITDATGCVAYDCFWNQNPCSALIIEQEDSSGVTGLFAISNLWPATYLWNNGATENVIFPSSSGNYCVTVTGGGCVTSTCYYYTVPSNMQINGYVYHPDSLNAGQLEGIVELFYNDPTNNTWGLVSTTAIDASLGSGTFAFGNQTNPGQYILKATLDPASPFAADFLPTYHYSEVLWDEANIITLPSSGWGLYSILLSDGQNFTGGSGNISGTVTEGDGLTANEEGERGGAPRPNTSVVLFDNLEQPITHQSTDDMGRYSFGDLPMGTYKVVVDVVGKDITEQWVTLTTDNANITDLNFEVTETGVVLLSNINDLLESAKLTAYPNPSNGQLRLMFKAKANFEATIKLSRLDGTTVLFEKQEVAMGQKAIDFDMYNVPTGLYLLQLTTEKGVATTKIVKQ
jgi:hypothetical protein